MREADYGTALSVAAELAHSWLEGIPERPTSIVATAAEILADHEQPFPDDGTAPSDVLRELSRIAEPGLAATGSGRYFGLVTGGSLPAALGADWMVSAWDQNAVFADLYPAVVAVELMAARWVLEALDLPRSSAVGFCTGGQGANTAGLLAARHSVLAAHDYDVEAGGLRGAPSISVIASAERHSTVDRALRLLGLGTDSVRNVAADNEGRIDMSDFVRALEESDGPTIVCAQAGNVNGGAFDPLDEIAAEVNHRRSIRNDIWLHVDGAFGLWVRASETRRHLAVGADAADSWATDAHKWLNTPYDCGITIVRDRQALGRAIGYRAAYLPSPGAVPDSVDSVVESSRRARGVPVWAALRSLGRAGLAALVDRCCDRAAELAALLSPVDGVEVMQTQINQIVIAFNDSSPMADHDGHTQRVLSAIQDSGVCFPTGTVWHGRSAIRVSVSNWRTDEIDIDETAAALIDAHSTTG